jgi:hypothetical protein
MRLHRAQGGAPPNACGSKQRMLGTFCAVACQPLRGAQLGFCGGLVRVPWMRAQSCIQTWPACQPVFLSRLPLLLRLLLLSPCTGWHSRGEKAVGGCTATLHNEGGRQDWGAGGEEGVRGGRQPCHPDCCRCWLAEHAGSGFWGQLLTQQRGWPQPSVLAGVSRLAAC